MTALDEPADFNEACTHPKVTHRHGTYACYVLDKCRCRPCSKVTVAQRKEQVRRQNYAKHGATEYAPYVDASAALAHVEELRLAGIGYKDVARRAGVTSSTIGALLWETPSRARGKRTRIARDTEARILAVQIPTPEDLLDGHRVDATPTRNRLRALIRAGYSVYALCRLMDADRQVFDAVTSGARMLVTARTHRAAQGAFADLWDKPNNPTEWRASIAAARSRNRAIAAGWPVPIDVDELGYIEHDTPIDVEDDIDWIAVRRVLNGEGRADLTSLEKDAAIELGMRQGLSHREIAARAGMSMAAVAQRSSRKGLVMAS